MDNELKKYQRMCGLCRDEMITEFIPTFRPITPMPKERIIKPVSSFENCDIFKNKWWSQFIISRANWTISYRCPKCKLITIDYDRVYTNKEAKEIGCHLIKEKE